MKDIEAIEELTWIGLIAAVIAFFIFGFGFRNHSSRFRLFPASSTEWLAYWFHTLEFLVCCCLIISQHPGLRRIPQPAADVHLLLTLLLPLFLLLSSVLFRRYDQALASRGLVWTVVAVIGVLLVPAIPVTKLA